MFCPVVKAGRGGASCDWVSRSANFPRAPIEQPTRDPPSRWPLSCHRVPVNWPGPSRQQAPIPKHGQQPIVPAEQAVSCTDKGWEWRKLWEAGKALLWPGWQSSRESLRSLPLWDISGHAPGVSSSGGGSTFPKPFSNVFK